jgi:hypothetical protein
MIYTVGNKENYFKAIAVQGTIFKVGKTDDWLGELYVGGCCFKTYEDAQIQADAWTKELNREFAVYGLDADWDTQTEQNEKESYHSLLIDAPIIVLEDSIS